MIHHERVLKSRGGDPSAEVCSSAFLQVPVSRWGRLDASAPSADYAEGGSTLEVATLVSAFSPGIVMVVDWSGLELYRRLRQRLKDDALKVTMAPMVYLNYRVFSRTAVGEDLELVSR